MKWSEEKCVELIGLYQKYELLWKSKHPQHYNKLKKQDAWEEISQGLNVDPEECKKKMGSLLSSFRRENTKIKKRRGTGTGRDDTYESSWFAFKAMIFLQDKDEPGSRLSAFVENEYSNSSAEETGAPTVDTVLQCIVENMDQTPPPSTENFDRIPPPSKQQVSKSNKRSRTTDERLDRAVNILEASVSSVSSSVKIEESEHQIFGRLVAKKLQGYSSVVSSIVQEEIMKIIFKADRGFYKNN